MPSALLCGGKDCLPISAGDLPPCRDNVRYAANNGHRSMPIGSFRWHGVTVKRGQLVIVSRSSGSVSQANNARTVQPFYRVMFAVRIGPDSCGRKRRKKRRVRAFNGFTVLPIVGGLATARKFYKARIILSSLVISAILSLGMSSGKFGG